LASWGLHRMGPGDANFGDIEQLTAGFREPASKIERV
jgi:hypothetical protein